MHYTIGSFTDLHTKLISFLASSNLSLDLMKKLSIEEIHQQSTIIDQLSYWICSKELIVVKIDFAEAIIYDLCKIVKIRKIIYMNKL